MRAYRRHLGAAALAVLLVTSGCTGFLTGEEALVFEAEPAVADDAVASDAGYGTDGPRERPVNRTFDVAGQSRTVRVVNQVTTYEKRLDLPVVEDVRLGAFSVVSSPAVEIAGREFNPLADYSTERLVRMAGSDYGGFDDVERVSARTATVLGRETEVIKYATTARVDGASVEVYVHVTRVRHGDDYVVAVGVYPRQLSGEEANVSELMRSIEHPA